MDVIAQYGKHLEFFDISHCTKVTDVGLAKFEAHLDTGSPYKIRELFFNGLLNVTNVGLIAMFNTIKNSLQILELTQIDSVRKFD
jgi:hypothetical protein